MSTTTTTPDVISLRHWLVVIGSGLMMAANVLLFLASGLLLPGLAESLGIGLGQAMMFTTIYMLSGAAVMAIAGPGWTERYGMRALVLVGGIVSGAALVAVSFVGNVLVFYVLAFASGVFGPLVTQMSGAVLIHDWFEERRGAMLGILMAVAGVGGIVAGVVMPMVVAAGGWRLGFQVVGALTIAISAGCALFLIRSKPSDVGLRPFGAGHEHHVDAAPVQGAPASIVMRSPLFFVVLLGLTLYTALMAIQQHFPKLMGEHGLDLAAAGSLLTVLSLVNIGTTLAFGLLTDRLGPTVSYLIVGTLLAVSLVVLQVGSGYVPQLVGIVLFSMPAIMPPVITPLVIRHAFGARAFVTLLGIGTASMPVGIALGAPLWGLSPDLTGSYTTAMWAGVAVTVAAVVLVCFGLVAGARRFADVDSEDAQEAGE